MIVGQESGNVSRLSFVRFSTERAAQAWVERMNRDSPPNDLIRYEYRLIRLRPGIHRNGAQP